MKKISARLFAVCYIAIVLILGLRPKIPYLFDNFMPLSSAGGYNMYQYLVEEEIECFVLLDEKKKKIDIDWKRHMYHSTFVSSPHPNYRKVMGGKFCDYLMKYDTTLDSLKKRNESFELQFNITIIKEKQDTLRYEYYR